MILSRSGTPRLLLLLLSVLFLGACNVTKNLADHEYLLVKNKFTVDERKISTDDLSGYLQQNPNDKLFGLFRTNIALYNMGSKGKDTKFKKWLRTKAGSAPVVLDTSLVSISAKQMKLFLNNKGYFHSVVSDSITYHKKKATVHFMISAGQAYTFRSIKYLIADTQLASYVFRDTSRSLIRSRSNYDAYLLDDERTRITNNLLNQGYYHFNPGFIVFRLDSNLNRRQMDVLMEIVNPVIPSLTGFG
jgi:archaellin